MLNQSAKKVLTTARSPLETIPAVYAKATLGFLASLMATPSVEKYESFLAVASAVPFLRLVYKTIDTIKTMADADQKTYCAQLAVSYPRLINTSGASSRS